MSEIKNIMPYRLRNTLLGVQSEWMINKTTLALTQDAEKDFEDYEIHEGQKDLKTTLEQYVTEVLPDVFTMPLFTQEFCDMMMDEIKHMEEYLGFDPNPEEDLLRQIPEITLHDNCPPLFENLWSVALNHLNPAFMALWQRHSVRPGSIQLANYNIAKKSQGAWHHDTSADISVVVPLNTGSYKGGGTEFHRKGIVEPLPSGTALMFPSFSHLHRGLPVEDGDRYLLVFWLMGNFD
jgi:hypothetical protein